MEILPNSSDDEYEVTISVSELRQIIRGEINFRKCPECNGKLVEYTVQYESAKPEDASDPCKIESISEELFQYWDFSKCAFIGIEIPDHWIDPEAHQSTCEVCKGLGYVSNELNN